MKTKNRILSETPDEVKQRVRDRDDLLVNKEKTLEEAAERLYSDKLYPMYGSIRRDAFINGAKWQQERSYSELIKELELIKSKQMNSYFKKFYDETIEFIEKFKKK